MTRYDDGAHPVPHRTVGYEIPFVGELGDLGGQVRQPVLAADRRLGRALPHQLPERGRDARTEVAQDTHRTPGKGTGFAPHFHS